MTNNGLPAGFEFKKPSIDELKIMVARDIAGPFPGPNRAVIAAVLANALVDRYNEEVGL